MPEYQIMMMQIPYMLAILLCCLYKIYVATLENGLLSLLTETALSTVSPESAHIFILCISKSIIPDLSSDTQLSAGRQNEYIQTVCLLASDFN